MTAPQRVLIGCETSGMVRRAFLAAGHDAWSCDLLPAEDRSNRHIIGDVREVMQGDWDLLAVMHPPCTRLCNSGVRWYHEPPRNPPATCTEQEAAAWPGLSRRARLDMLQDHLRQGAALFSDVWNVAHIPRVAVENPVMHRHAKALIRNYAKPARAVQPWHFGTDPDGPDNVKKSILFWLRDLPALTPTGTLDGTTLPYASSTAGQGRETEIRDTLRGVGATAVGFMIDDDSDMIIAQFRLHGRQITIPVRVGAYAEAWLRENPHTTRMRSTPDQHREKARKQAERAAWAILADWIKAQAAMITVGFLDTDTAFLPHVHLPDGRRVGEAIASPDNPLALPKPDQST